MKLLYKDRKFKGNVTYRMTIHSHDERLKVHIIKLRKKRSKDPGVTATKEVVTELNFWADEAPEISDDVMKSYISDELSKLNTDGGKNGNQ